MRQLEAPIRIEHGSGGWKFLVDDANELILSARDTSTEELGQVVSSFNGAHAAKLFMDELLGSVETLTGIVDEHGARTLSDLMYLQNAILTGGAIDNYPDESKVLEIAKALPSGDQWVKFIVVDYKPSHAKP